MLHKQLTYLYITIATFFIFANVTLVAALKEISWVVPELSLGGYHAYQRLSAKPRLRIMLANFS